MSKKAYSGENYARHYNRVSGVFRPQRKSVEFKSRIVCRLKISMGQVTSLQSQRTFKDFLQVRRERLPQAQRNIQYYIWSDSSTERVAQAKPAINQAFADYKQQEFISFILGRYIEDGVEELASRKMRSLIELKYNTIGEAAKEFGSPAVIRETFIGFQKYLYQQSANG